MQDCKITVCNSPVVGSPVDSLIPELRLVILCLDRPKGKKKRNHCRYTDNHQNNSEQSEQTGGQRWRLLSAHVKWHKCDMSIKSQDMLMLVPNSFSTAVLVNTTALKTRPAVHTVLSINNYAW